MKVAGRAFTNLYRVRMSVAARAGLLFLRWQTRRNMWCDTYVSATRRKPTIQRPNRRRSHTVPLFQICEACCVRQLLRLKKPSCCAPAAKCVRPVRRRLLISRPCDSRLRCRCRCPWPVLQKAADCAAPAQGARKPLHAPACAPEGSQTSRSQLAEQCAPACGPKAATCAAPCNSSVWPVCGPKDKSRCSKSDSKCVRKPKAAPACGPKVIIPAFSLEVRSHLWPEGQELCRSVRQQVRSEVRSRLRPEEGLLWRRPLLPGSVLRNR